MLITEENLIISNVLIRGESQSEDKSGQNVFIRKRCIFPKWRSYEIQILMGKLSEIYDLSIASTKTKYIKLNTKTKNIFCRLNKNLMIFLYSLEVWFYKNGPSKVDA